MKASDRFRRMEKSGEEWDKNMEVRKGMPVSSDSECDPFHDAKNRNGEGYDSQGNKLGGLNWKRRDDEHHVTAYDARNNRRISTDYGEGKYHKHETDQTNGHHHNGAYNGHSPNGSNGVAKNKNSRWNQQADDDYYSERRQREARKVVEDHNKAFWEEHYSKQRRRLI